MKSIIWLFALVFLGVGTLSAQDEKIGYANVEVILSYMPETQTISQSLTTLENKLGERLQIKEQYIQSKVTDYQEQAGSGKSEADLKPLEDEIRKLNAELQREAAEAEQKVLQKRSELLEPALKKLQAAIKKVAADKDYAFVVNASDSGGKSILIKGPPEANLNEAILKELGVEIPSGDNN